jgi:hypothetical protein
MLIIPIDTFNRKQGIQGNADPLLIMNEKGVIKLNVSAAKLLNLQDATPVYMHFYEDAQDLYIKVDNDPIHAIKLTFKEKAATCGCYAKNTVKYLIEKCAPGTSQLTFSITKSDFGKFKLTIKN